MAVSVFAFHTSHQTTKAIDMCRKIIPLTEKLITEMPCYVYPYANIFSVLPFLHVYQLNDLVEKVCGSVHINLRIIKRFENYF
jgi:hypothetical protein